jgi:mRNA interferase MazF
MVIEQGDVVWVDLPPPRGSEPAGRRPALVIQSDIFNRSRINTIVVAVLTSNLKYESLPGNVRLTKGEAALPRPSVINLSQIHSIGRAYIREKIGSLSTKKWETVKAGLKLVLAL